MKEKRLRGMCIQSEDYLPSWKDRQMWMPTLTWVCMRNEDWTSSNTTNGIALLMSREVYPDPDQSDCPSGTGTGTDKKNGPWSVGGLTEE